MKVVGITGTLNSGKDLLAAEFIARGFVRMAFADPLKDAVHRIFRIPTEILWGDSNKRDTRTRKILQELGTDFARKYDPEIWVKRTLERIENWRLGLGDKLELLEFVEGPVKIVVPDVRFPNEAQALKTNYDAKLIRVYRPNASKGKDPETLRHESETLVDKIPLELHTHTFRNTGTLKEAILEAKKMAELLDD